MNLDHEMPSTVCQTRAPTTSTEYKANMVRTSIAGKLRAAGSNASAARAGGSAPPSTSGAVAVVPQSPHGRRGGGSPLRSEGRPEAPAALITPPPSPVLLLEGDELFVSKNGTSRTFYRLTGTSTRREFVLEESYDIARARKRMDLLRPPELRRREGQGTTEVDDVLGDRTVPRHPSVFSLDLQEIGQGVQHGCGTGSMTWDSGIVMGLYFASHPEELRGDVLELGSGVGLGGIMCSAAARVATRSVTLTDVNEDVLDVLRRNLNAVAATSYLDFKGRDVNARRLDWFDYLGGLRGGSTRRRQYDTLLASDCAYLHSQVKPLSNAISKLLGRRDGRSGRMHMFAPYNRGVVYELIEELDASGMHTRVEEVEMAKYRVRQEETEGPSGLSSRLGYAMEDWPWSPPNAARGVSRFLHITAWHDDGRQNPSADFEMGEHMSDID
ncbi:hypothetical protein ACHAWF_015302 [Thalassiosira exigua]